VRTQIPGKQILDSTVDTADLKDTAVTDAKLSDSGVLPGAYTKVTVGQKGRVTLGENPTTIAGYGITDAVSETDPRFLISVITAKHEAGNPLHRHLHGTPNQIITTDAGPGLSLDVGIAPNPIIPGSGGLTLPIGTTVERLTGTNGMIRFNSDSLEAEIFRAEWDAVVMSSDNRLAPGQTLIVSKLPGKGQFSSIGAALASITDNSTTKRYTIKVRAGTYIESTLTMKRWVSVVGDSGSSTVIENSNPDSHLIMGANDARVQGVTLTGSTGTGFAAVYFKDAPENTSTRIMLVENVTFGANYRHMHVVSTGSITAIFAMTCLFGGTAVYNQALVAESSNNGFARIFLKSGQTASATAPLPQEFAYATGKGAELVMSACLIRISTSTPSGKGVRVRDGGLIRISGVTMRGFEIGIFAENAGVAPTVQCYNVGMESNTTDLMFDHPGTVGTYFGTADRTKVIDNSGKVSILYLDPVDPGINIVGSLNIGTTASALTNVTDLILKTPALGVLSGGIISRASGLVVDVTGGKGYLWANSMVKRVVFTGAQFTIAASTSPYIYVTEAGIIASALSKPDPTTTMLIGRVVAGSSTIATYVDLRTRLDGWGTNVEQYLRNVIGPVFISGQTVSEGTAPLSINVSAGVWNYGTQTRLPSETLGGAFFDMSRSGGQVTVIARTTFSNTTRTGATDEVPLTAGYFAKHTLLTASDGAGQAYFVQHARTEYATLAAAVAAPLDGFLLVPDSSPPIASIIVQQGNPNIVQIIDLRPFVGGARSVSSAGGVTVHGDLLGLSADNHLQYLRVDGVRAMLGDLNLGANSITNVGTVNGISITTHASRHQPNGADPLSTGSAVGISTSTVNGIGVSNDLARADHTHALTGVQASSPVLSGITALSGNGIIVKSGTGAVTRLIAGTAGRVILSNADGVLGDPTIDLSTVIAPGTFTTVAVDAYGRVTSGSATQDWTTITGTPTTLAGYGIANAQPLDADLTALAAIGTTGFYIIAGNGASVTRSLVAPTDGISIANSTGLAGDPTFSLTNDLAAVEALITTGIAVRTGADSWATRIIAGPTSGITVSNGSGVGGNPTLNLVNDLAALEGLTTFGFAVRTAADTWATRVIGGTAGNILITNGTGISGDLSVNLSTVGIAGSYHSVTTDAFGRVTAGTNPTTLAGYGITDAQGLDSDLTALANTATTGAYTITGAGTSATRVLTAGSTKVSVVNGSGVVGNPTVDIVETNLVLNNIGGVLSTTKGGTGLAVIGGANSLLGVNLAGTALEYSGFTTGTNLVLTRSANLYNLVIADNPVFTGTAGIVVPASTTAARANTTGAVRLNTTVSQFEGFTGTQWVPLSTAASVTQYFKGSVPQTSGTSIVPYGNTAPTITQGTQLWSQTLTPFSNSSSVEVEFTTIGDLSSSSAYIILSAFRGNTLIGMSVLASGKLAGADFTSSFVIRVIDIPGTTTPVTYSVRVGGSVGTWYVGRGQNATFGGTNPSYWTIKEFS